MSVLAVALAPSVLTAQQRATDQDVRDAPAAVSPPGPRTPPPETTWGYRGTGTQMTQPAEGVGSDATTQKPASLPWVGGAIAAGVVVAVSSLLWRRG